MNILDKLEQFKLHLIQKPALATELYQEILADLEHLATEEQARIHQYLGLIFKNSGQLKPAFYHSQSALYLQPDKIESYINLANVYLLKEEFQDAFELLNKAQSIDSKHYLVNYNLAYLFQVTRQNQLAIEFYLKALEHKPDLIQALNNIAHLYQLSNQPFEAIRFYLKALEYDSEQAQVLSNLGNSFEQVFQWDKALDAHLQAIQLDANTPSLNNLAELFQHLGDYQQARLYFQACIDNEPTKGIQIKKALCLPVILQNQNESTRLKERVEKDLQACLNENYEFHQIVKEANPVPFYLWYHIQPNRRIPQLLAQVYLRMAPQLEQMSSSSERKASSTIRVGFISLYFFQHSIGKFMHGILEQLNRDFFEVVLFVTNEPVDSLSEQIQNSANTLIKLPMDIEEMKQKISQEKLDILFYCDISMDSFTYFLSFSRLAPIQMTTWGQGGTSGIPNMDYFISSHDLETRESFSTYSEKLILMPELFPYYYPPACKNSKSRNYFGFNQNQNLYFCPHSLFKIQPEFDLVLGEILKKDPESILIFIEGAVPHWTDKFKARINESIDFQYHSQIKFLPQMKQDEFIELADCCDVLLEPFENGGGITSYDTFYTGLPTVIWPSNYSKGRVTYALYLKMGILDCVAKSAKDYIHLSLKMGTDKQFNQLIRQKIKDNCPKIYRNLKAVKDFENILMTLHHQINESL